MTCKAKSKARFTASSVSQLDFFPLALIHKSEDSYSLMLPCIERDPCDIHDLYLKDKDISQYICNLSMNAWTLRMVVDSDPMTNEFLHNCVLLKNCYGFEPNEFWSSNDCNNETKKFELENISYLYRNQDIIDEIKYITESSKVKG